MRFSVYSQKTGNDDKKSKTSGTKLYSRVKRQTTSALSRELKKSTTSASKSILEKEHVEEPQIFKSKSTTLIQNKESVVTTKSAEPPKEFVGSF